MVREGKLETTGPDQEVRAPFVALQGIVEHVLSCELQEGLSALKGVILTPMPPTPLCMEGKISEDLVDPSIEADPRRAFTVKARATSLRDLLHKGGVIYCAYPKGGLERRTQEQQQIYREACLAYPNHLRDRPLDCASLPEDLMGAAYLFTDREGESYAFSIRMTQAKDLREQGRFALWYGPLKEQAVGERVEELFSYVEEHLSDAALLNAYWECFQEENPYSDSYTTEQVVEIANQYGKRMADTLSLSAPVREIDYPEVQKLISLVRERGCKLFMRHGAQQKTERVNRLAPPEQKVEMMRLPDNMVNGLESASMCELLELMIVFRHVQEASERCFYLESSENRRAIVPAEALGKALDVQVKLNPELLSVNYPPNEVMSTETLLQLLPDGALPWEREKVDTIIGPGTYETITESMSRLIEKGFRGRVLLAITHTQQLNAAAVLKGLPATRLGNFGFIVLTESQKEIFSDSLFGKS